MRYFLAVAEAKSISGAGAVLGTPHSTISQSVQTLERELGATLFDRTGRGVVLTPAGHALLGPTRRLLRDLQQAEAVVSADSSLRAPRLQLAALEFALNGPLADVLAAFLRAHPDADVDVHEAASEPEIADLLASGTAEIIATRLPLELGQAAGQLATLPLGGYDVYVAHPPPDPDGEGPLPSGAEGLERPVTLAELRDVPLVLIPPHALVSAGMEAMIDENAPHLRRRAVVGRRETRTAWMLEGIASTLLGTRAARFAARRGARLAPLSGASEITIGLVWDPRTLSAQGQALVAVATDVAARAARERARPAPADPGGRPARSAGTAADPAP